MEGPLITNDAIVFGLLVTVLGGVFYTRSLGGRWTTFYTFLPAILMCYLLPSLMNSFGLISSSVSNLWPVAKNFLLPASLVLMTLSIDLKAILGLGNKALVMFGTATVGIIIGGPVAILLVSLFSPETVGGEGADAAWRGFATLAGSWIGGGANQAAMLATFEYNPERYSAMIAIDIVVANLWMAFLLYGAGNPKPIDRWLKADTSAIDALKDKMEKYVAESERPSTTVDFMMIAAIAFAAVGLSHLLAEMLVFALSQVGSLAEDDSILINSFFWVVVISTIIGISLSFTRFRELEGAGASKIGVVFIFLLVAVIGTRMDIFRIADQPLLVLVGIIWMLFHVGLLVVVAKFIRAPFFFVAIGSKANIGGAASAPVLAAAFHPALAPVGVLLAVLGYAAGTGGALLCAYLMRLAAP